MIEESNLGGWAIDKSLLDWILVNVPKGSVILEFGSGTGSIELAKHYKMYSVEHDPKWLGKAPSVNYIHAPITNGWYDPKKVFDKLEGVDYKLILIDGPPGFIGRSKILNHIDKLNTSVPIIVDDTNRVAERSLADQLSKTLKKASKSHITKDKGFTILM